MVGNIEKSKKIDELMSKLRRFDAAETSKEFEALFEQYPKRSPRKPQLPDEARHPSPVKPSPQTASIFKPKHEILVEIKLDEEKSPSPP